MRYLVGIAGFVKRTMQGINTLLPVIVHAKEEKEEERFMAVGVC